MNPSEKEVPFVPIPADLSELGIRFMSTVAVVTVAELTINEVKVDTPVTLKSS